MSKLNPELTEMAELFGEEGLREIIEAYQRSLVEFEVFLKKQTLDPIEVKSQAHKMKSPSRSVGELEIAAFCEALEKSGSMSDEVRSLGLQQIQAAQAKLAGF